MNLEEQAAYLEAIYAKLPDMKCKGLCASVCGVIAVSETEGARLAAHIGVPLPEPLHDAQNVCTFLAQTPEEAALPVLKSRDYAKRGRCTVYAIRPIICRLYGLTLETRCPHGCVPSRWISPAEARMAVRAVMALDSVAGDSAESVADMPLSVTIRQPQPPA